MSLAPYRTTSIFLLCLSGVAPLFSDEPNALTIGSPAPPLKIQHWIPGNAKDWKPVESFEKDKVYVIEFWATTCGPCRQSIPHLAALQEKYLEKGVRIIGVSNESLDEVNEFLKSKAIDVSGKATTMKELTSKYSLTTDPDGSTDVDYMLAAKQDGIPTTFIVGKDTRIEWIGHPMEMVEVLDEVVKGTWDRKKHKEEQELFAEVQSTITNFVRKKEFQKAITALDGFLQRTNEPRIQFILHKTKIDMQVRAGVSSKESPKEFARLFQICKDEPMFIQDIAWTAYELFISDELKDTKVIQSAVVAMESSMTQVSDGSMKANMFDTLAHLQYVLGNLKGALASEAKAIGLADAGQKPGFEEFLAELRSQEK